MGMQRGVTQSVGGGGGGGGGGGELVGRASERDGFAGGRSWAGTQCGGGRQTVRKGRVLGMGKEDSEAGEEEEGAGGSGGDEAAVGLVRFRLPPAFGFARCPPLFKAVDTVNVRQHHRHHPPTFLTTHTTTTEPCLPTTLAHDPDLHLGSPATTYIVE